MKLVFILSVFMLIAANISAQEILTIESTITGSKEQPKVITIIPWQRAKKPGYFGDDIKGLDGYRSELIPLRRENFQRELKYRHDLQP